MVSHDLHGHIANHESGGGHTLDGRREEDLAVSIRKPGVGSAEVRSEVTETRCGKQGIADGVTHSIPIAVAGKADIARPEHAAEPERAGGVERVHIDADARARLGTLGHGDERLRTAKVPRCRDLECAKVALDHPHLVTGGREQCRVIGVVRQCIGVGRSELLTGETLRSLHSDEIGPIDCGDRTPVLHPLDRVGNRKAGDDARSGLTHGSDYRVELR